MDVMDVFLDFLPGRSHPRSAETRRPRRPREFPDPDVRDGETNVESFGNRTPGVSPSEGIRRPLRVRIRLSAVLVVLPLAFASGTAMAGDATCLRAGAWTEPVAVVEPIDDGLTLDLGRTSVELTGMGPEVRQGNRTRGLTTTSLSYRTKLSYQGYSLPDGTFCEGPMRAEVSVGYPGAVVYVAVEYPPSSCEYAAVMEHEMTHVAIYRTNLTDEIPRLRQALERALSGPEFPLLVSTSDGAVEYMKTLVKRTVEIELNDMTERRTAQDRLLDSPASYAYTQNRCRGW